MFYYGHRLFAFICLSILVILPASVRAEKKHRAEEIGIKSDNSDAETKIMFANKSGKTIRVYWLDYDGNRKLYHTLKDGEIYEQLTFLTHPWVITDENDDAWFLYFADAQPRSISIVAPKN